MPWFCLKLIISFYLINLFTSFVMASILIDCEYFSIKQSKLVHDENVLDFAVRDQHSNIYFVYELTAIIFDRETIYATYHVLFRTNIYLSKLDSASELHRSVIRQQHLFGGVLNYGAYKQCDVKRVLSLILAKHKPVLFYYKGGLVEKTLYQMLNCSPAKNLELFGCKKTPLFYYTPCRIHRNKRSSHCSLIDVFFYVTSLLPLTQRRWFTYNFLCCKEDEICSRSRFVRQRDIPQAIEF